MPQPFGDFSPAISVVVRTLGSERLGDALESLALQTRQDFEVVVVDMSNGHIEGLLDRFASRLPSLRRVTLAGRRTRPAALNAGVRAARAPLLAVLDDDNLYDPGHLETLVGALETSGADYVYTGVRRRVLERAGALEAGRRSDVRLRERAPPRRPPAFRRPRRPLGSREDGRRRPRARRNRLLTRAAA